MFKKFLCSFVEYFYTNFEGLASKSLKSNYISASVAKAFIIFDVSLNFLPPPSISSYDMTELFAAVRP